MVVRSRFVLGGAPMLLTQEHVHTWSVFWFGHQDGRLRLMREFDATLGNHELYRNRLAPSQRI